MHKFHRLFALLFAWFSLAFTQVSLSQDLSFLLPWTFPKKHANWEGFEFKYTEIKKSFEESLLQDPKPMSDVLTEKPLFWHKWSTQVLTGNNQYDFSEVIHPISCGIGSKFLIGLTSVNSAHELVGSFHLVLDDMDSLDQNTLLLLAEGFKKSRVSVRNQNLKAGLFSVKLGSHGSLQTDCLNFLLAESLLPKVRIVQSYMRDDHKRIQNLMNQDSNFLKSNRNLTLNWNAPSWDEGKVILSYRGHWTESVFGEKLGPPKEDVLEGQIASGSFQVLISEASSMWLEKEEASISDEMPQVVHQDRGWIYLDKGRAWGLKMKDRVRFADESIKGHVVGFYGPRSGLKKDGRLISEGAIVYIRKGQRDVQLGMPMEWDPVEYPTAWK